MMLAMIVGIGWVIYKQAGMAEQINTVFNNAADLMTKSATQSKAPSNG